ncbi:hypothetical protein M569_00999 [Genlisea aurea]|uniref:DUF7356 domain-containing protein n=1 Tax=Genlisea aurea TaxID=192259 RepID=S8D1V1_9LAMI|nr:hypothetical protein M569_00999 [Genlisea aurea]
MESKEGGTMRCLGDDKSALLDEYERLSFEVHLNNAVLGRSRSEAPPRNERRRGRGGFRRVWKKENMLWGRQLSIEETRLLGSARNPKIQKFSCGMGGHRTLAVVFIILLLLVSVNCEAGVLNHVRKLFIAEANNSSAQKVSPITSSVNESNANPMNAGKPIHKSDTNKENADAGVLQSSTKESVNPNSTTPRGEDNIDSTTSVIANSTKPALGSKEICKGSLASCNDQGMLACLRASKESKQLSLLVQNQGGSNLKVKVILPDPTIAELPLLELPAGETEKMDISPATTTVTLASGKAQCTLHLNGDPGSRFHPVSFYSMQISPVFSIYVAGALVLVLGGVVTCCKVQKRKEEDGIAYEEVEMGLASAEGWDNDWDSDDNWDEGTAVVSPAAARGRASGNGLISRSAAKEGWDD